MFDFVNYECVRELFEKNDGAGYENCIFIARKNYNAQGMQAGLSGTLGIVGGCIADKIREADMLGNLYFDAMLLNLTEKGIGFIPLWNKGISLSTPPIAKMEPKINNYFFVDEKSLKNVTIKNFSFLNRKLKKITIMLHSGGKIQLLARLKEKEIPYHEINFAKFMHRFENRFS